MSGGGASRSRAGRRTNHGATGGGSHAHKRHYHKYYRDHGIHVSFRYGSGPYTGFRYYSPYYDYVDERHCAFFYPAPVSYVYVPFGFYADSEPVYVTESEAIEDSYGAPRYESVEVDDATSNLPVGLPGAGSTSDSSAPVAPSEEDGAADRADDTAIELEPMETITPNPAAGGPVTEKFLREASESFSHGDYVTAAEKFRLASVSAPQLASPLFALGQSLIAVGSDDYAVRVMRRALDLAPELVKQTGDVTGVYRSPQEFDRVMAELRERAAKSEPGSDSRFLLGLQEYFSGDPRARGTFAEYLEVRPADAAAKLMKEATDIRFRAAELPPVSTERAQSSVD